MYNWDYWSDKYPGTTSSDLSILYPKTDGLREEFLRRLRNEINMVKKTEYGYLCSICGTAYERDTYALSCEQGHNVIYVPFKSEDLLKLIQFLYTKDESLLSESLVKTLMAYRSRNYYNKEE